jgi:hypothetical protein
MWWMIAAASAAVGQPAGPIYLACSITNDAGQLAVDLAVDESGQQATVSLPSTGYSARRTAIFTPTEVRVTDGPGTWVVDRVSLAFERVLVIGGKQWNDRGSCKLKPAPAKRAF